MMGIRARMSRGFSFAQELARKETPVLATGFGEKRRRCRWEGGWTVVLEGRRLVVVEVMGRW
jgi:hypothetical protein